MAKKKVNIEIPRSGAAAEVPSGDVNIVYNNVRIAGLSETVDATLKTGGTVVQHDIEVEYVKPAAGISLPEISGSYPDQLGISGGTSSVMLFETNNKIVRSLRGIATKQYLIPSYISSDDLYVADLIIYRNIDDLNVIINNTPVLYDTDKKGYYYKYSSSTYPEGFTVMVTNKE